MKRDENYITDYEKEMVEFILNNGHLLDKYFTLEVCETVIKNRIGYLTEEIEKLNNSIECPLNNIRFIDENKIKLQLRLQEKELLYKMINVLLCV